MNDSEPEDINFEPNDESGEPESVQAKLKKLRTELKEAQAKRDEYLDGWQRCKADGINARREIETRAQQSAQMLREALVHDIIPALDSFDMAAGSEAWAEVSDGWRSGMEQVRNQLLEALRSHGIERYGKVGDHFDHARYDAVEERDDMPGEPGEVVRILRFGYRTKDKVLRPAQVIVKK